MIDNDFILVLGHGRVLEFGSPSELLERSSGHFSSMVNDTGQNMSRDLRQRALNDKEEKQ